MSDDLKRPDLQALHTYFARASDCSHMDLRTIGELLEYAGRLEAQVAELEAERDHAKRVARAWKQKAKAEREQRREWQWDFGEAE